MQAVSKCTCGKLELPLLIHRSAGTGRKSAPPPMHRDYPTVHGPEWVEWEGTHSVLLRTGFGRVNQDACMELVKEGCVLGRLKGCCFYCCPVTQKWKKPRRLCQVLYRTEMVKGENIWVLIMRTTEDSSKNRSNQVNIGQKAVAEVVKVLVWT